MTSSTRIALVSISLFLSSSAHALLSPSEKLEMVQAKSKQSEAKSELLAIYTSMLQYKMEFSKFPTDIGELAKAGSWKPYPLPRLYVVSFVCPKRGSTVLDLGAKLDEEVEPHRAKILDTIARLKIDCEGRKYLAVAVGVPNKHTSEIDIWTMDDKNSMVALRDISKPDELKPLNDFLGVTGAQPTVATAPSDQAKAPMKVDRAQLKFEGDTMTARAVVDSKTRRPIGIALEKMTEASPMMKLGFKNKDILIAVNSHVMVEPSALLLLSKSISVAKSHDYEVTRDGARVTWRVEFVDGGGEASAPPAKPVPMAGEKPERMIRLKKSAVDAANKDMMSFLESARLVPEMDKSGNVRCFRVVHTNADSIFKLAGLLPGDCVLAANEKLLDSPSASMDLYMDVQKNGGPVTYVVERKGKLKKIGVDVE
ncbi:MAG: hypothetical protein V4760_05685 [Bdellovibrionota bacterium]